MKNITEAKTFLQKHIFPPQLLHWKTSILISVFLFFLSISETKNHDLSNFLSDLSWLFLTIGIGWRTSQPPFLIRGISVSPWIIGALISILLSGKLEVDRQPLAIIFWPLISVCIAVIMKFVQSGGKFQKSEQLIRPVFLIILLVNVLISCWLGFHFTIQGWLKEYPSLLADDFSRSGFVISLEPRTVNNSRGMFMIKLMEEQLNIKARNQSWEKIEPWLISVGKDELLIRNEISKKISRLKENDRWDLKTQTTQGQSRYQITLLAVWSGPSTKPGGYTLSKFCEVTKMVNHANVTCQPIKMDNPTERKTKIKGEN